MGGSKKKVALTERWRGGHCSLGKEGVPDEWGDELCMGPTALATHLKQGHVLAIVLLSLLCVGAVDEGAALLWVAIT